MDDIVDLINEANENQRTAAIMTAYNIAAELPVDILMPDGEPHDIGGHLMRAIRHVLSN